MIDRCYQQFLEECDNIESFCEEVKKWLKDNMFEWEGIPTLFDSKTGKAIKFKKLRGKVWDGNLRLNEYKGNHKQLYVKRNSIICKILTNKKELAPFIYKDLLFIYKPTSEWIGNSLIYEHFEISLVNIFNDKFNIKERKNR